MLIGRKKTLGQNYALSLQGLDINRPARQSHVHPMLSKLLNMLKKSLDFHTFPSQQTSVSSKRGSSPLTSNRQMPHFSEQRKKKKKKLRRLVGKTAGVSTRRAYPVAWKDHVLMHSVNRSHSLPAGQLFLTANSLSLLVHADWC